MLTSKGYQRVAENIKQGRQDLVCIKTQIGDSLCTAEHRMAVMTAPDKYEWKYAKDLCENDAVVFNTAVVPGTTTELPPYKNEGKRSMEIKVPQLSTDIAWFFGYFHGNGNVYLKKDRGTVCISCPSNRPEIVRKVNGCISLFGITPKEYKQKNCVQVRGQTMNFALYFSQFKTSWQTMDVPRFILEGTPDIRAAYLAGLFDSGELHAILSSSYPEFLTQLQSVYASLGIPVCKRLVRDARKETHKDSYELHIIGKFSKERWASSVGVFSSEFVRYEYAKHTRYDEDYSFPRSWFSNVETSMNSNYKIQSPFMSVDEYAERYGKYPELFPVRVLSVEKGPSQVSTYDLSVENNHEYFCGEGLLNHNSALLALGDAKDVEYLRAKRWDLGNVPNSRAFSNNSVVCNDIQEILDNKEFWDGYNGGGECYGLVNLKLSQACGRLGETQYPDPDVIGYNPCCEQSLANHEVCCLAELYLPNIKTKEELYKCTTYLYRICKHSLALSFADSKETEDIVHKNMRMGVGVTGYLQATEEQRSWLKGCYEYIREVDKKYSIEKAWPQSRKICSVKPSGSLSLLGGVTSGVHPGFSQYYIRRIRIASESALIPLAKKHGYPVEYVKNFDGSVDHTTQIVSFPTALPEGTILAENTTAVQQLEYVKRLQTEWSDNAVSVTVYYRKQELPVIKDWLRQNYNNSVKSVSFLLHSDHGFLQAPLEAITKAQYDELYSKCKPINDVSGICFVKEKLELLSEGECAGGVCPLR